MLLVFDFGIKEPFHTKVSIWLVSIFYRWIVVLAASKFNFHSDEYKTIRRIVFLVVQSLRWKPHNSTRVPMEIIFFWLPTQYWSMIPLKRVSLFFWTANNMFVVEKFSPLWNFNFALKKLIPLKLIYSFLWAANVCCWMMSRHEWKIVCLKFILFLVKFQFCFVNIDSAETNLFIFMSGKCLLLNSFTCEILFRAMSRHEWKIVRF